MKKTLALVLSLIMVISMMAGIGISASAADTYKLKLNCPDTEGGLSFIIGTEFAKKAEELTNGAVKITVYGGSSLGTTTEALEGMAAGIADVQVESIGTLAPFTELANIDAMPYMYSGYEHFTKVWTSDLGKEILTKVGEDGHFKLMGASYRGARVVTATYEMKTVEDFKGFKLRAPGLDMYVKTWQWLGAAPTPLPITDVYTAIQQKTVEGQENSIIDSMNYSFDELCKYFILTNHVYSANTVIMDLDKFNSLPEDIQAALEEAAAYACEVASKVVLENEETKKEELVANGNVIVEVDNASFLEAFNGFAEENFPKLADWANAIRAMDAEEAAA